MDEKDREVQQAKYEKYKSNKKLVKENYPPIYEMEETLNVLRKMYAFLKERHFDLPKLDKTRIMAFPKGKSKPNPAYCCEKRIRYKHNLLKNRAGVFSFLGDDAWNIHVGTIMLFETLTHEIAHFRVTGIHNKAFYKRQRQLFATAINGIISGEYYQ